VGFSNLTSILIVGFGSIGQRHLKIAREFFPESKIGILFHNKTNEIPKYANEIFFSLSDAIQFKPQIAIVCSPASTHFEITTALVRKGIHVLIEKPISNESKGLEDLNNEADVNNCVLMVGYNLRFLPSLNKFKNLIDSDCLGKIFSVRCEVGQYLPSWRNKDYRYSVSAQKSLGGGVLLELSHELDYLRWIFGDVEFVQALIRKQSDLEVDVEDIAHIILSFKKNYKSFSLIASLSLDFIRQDRIRTCHVIGENGSLRWNGLNGRVDFFEPSSNKWRNLYRDKELLDQSYKKEWLHFVECIKNKSRPKVSFNDGIQVLKVIESIRIASSTGKKIKVK
jgi:predicted dehydrogenase